MCMVGRYSALFVVSGGLRYGVEAVSLCVVCRQHDVDI